MTSGFCVTSSTDIDYAAARRNVGFDRSVSFPHLSLAFARRDPSLTSHVSHCFYQEAYDFAGISLDRRSKDVRFDPRFRITEQTVRGRPMCLMARAYKTN